MERGGKDLGVVEVPRDVRSFLLRAQISRGLASSMTCDAWKGKSVDGRTICLTLRLQPPQDKDTHDTLNHFEALSASGTAYVLASEPNFRINLHVEAITSHSIFPVGRLH